MAFYGNSSYEAEREVDSYSTGYHSYKGEHVNSGFPVIQPRHNLVIDAVHETNVVIPQHGHHHHGGAVDYAERDERIVYENDSYADLHRVRPYY